MAGIEQLKKRLRSVELSRQLSEAMRTVASAKYARISAISTRYRAYCDELSTLSRFCGRSDAGENKAASPDARNCYVILGHNRGLCGGYNTELHNFAVSVLEKDPEAMVIVCGKAAVARFDEHRMRVDHRFSLPDVPDKGDCTPTFALFSQLFDEGKIASVSLVYQAYINTLTQRPTVKKLLPFATEESDEHEKCEETLFLPDRETINRDFISRIPEMIFYKTVLEATLGAQAATLMAMRTASDNAAKTAAKLQLEINKRRQSAVTTGVIETSSGMFGAETTNC